MYRINLCDFQIQIMTENIAMGLYEKQPSLNLLLQTVNFEHDSSCYYIELQRFHSDG